MKKITVNTKKIKDWQTFHEHFKEILAFPDFYGMNMNAWIDCVSSIRYPEDRMTNINLEQEEILFMEITDTKDFVSRCKEQFEGLIECSAFVNKRFIEEYGNPGIALVFLD